jgi:tetratricopeptide (TPR) repeat protein
MLSKNHCWPTTTALIALAPGFVFNRSKQLFRMKQAIRFIAVGIVATWAPAAFGSGSAPVAAPMAPPPQEQQTFAEPAKPTVDAAAIYNHGVALMHEKKYPEAVNAFENAVKANPDFAEAHNNLAYCLRQAGPSKFREALAHYNKAIELKPDLADAYEYRGVLFVKMNRMKDADKDLARLQKLNPKLAAKLEFAIKHNGQELAGY